MTQTSLHDAITQNRQRAIRVLELTARKATLRADYFRKQAQAIAANPKAWLDADGEIRFQLASAEIFDRRASDAQTKIAELKAKA